MVGAGGAFGFLPRFQRFAGGRIPRTAWMTSKSLVAFVTKTNQTIPDSSMTGNKMAMSVLTRVLQ